MIGEQSRRSPITDYRSLITNADMLATTPNTLAESPVLDGHSHAFPDEIAARAIETLTHGAQWFPVKAWHDGSVRGLLERMDEAGIRRSLMCSIATRPGQVRKITDWSAKVKSGRVIPFASIHPDFDEPEAEVERIASLGLPGLKFHPQYMNCPADDPRVIRIARAAAKAGLAMVFHAGFDLAFAKSDIASPRRIRNLHEAVPELRLLACHLGGWECWEESLAEVVGRPIYLETSFCLGQCDMDTLRRIIDKHSPDMLMFGSDSPWANPAADLAIFKELPLSPQAMTKALWENGNRFAGIASGVGEF
ncbi:MAG: amidohydrolase family protein [Tepidisphaeraceae bacterium]